MKRQLPTWWVRVGSGGQRTCPGLDISCVCSLRGPAGPTGAQPGAPTTRWGRSPGASASHDHSARPCGRDSSDSGGLLRARSPRPVVPRPAAPRRSLGVWGAPVAVDRLRAAPSVLQQVLHGSAACGEPGTLQLRFLGRGLGAGTGGRVPVRGWLVAEVFHERECVLGAAVPSGGAVQVTPRGQRPCSGHPVQLCSRTAGGLGVLGLTTCLSIASCC